MIVITGASGKLGKHVIEQIVKKTQPSKVVAAVRDPDKALSLRALGVEVRRADYNAPETLEGAFRGAKKVLLISSNELGRRTAQHAAVVEAAKKAGASLLAYTSVLRGDAARMKLAEEHKATEALIRGSGLPFVFLRNGWYFENYTENLAPALEHGALVGCAGDGRVAAAARADYAAAAVEVLTNEGHEGRVYELAGDRAFTMNELAAEVSRAFGRTIVYRNLPLDQHIAVLTGAGLPAAFAEIYADADHAISRGELDDDSGDLRRLIGRPTASLAAAVDAARR